MDFIEKEFRKKLVIISNDLKEALKIRAPVDTGRLRDSIKVFPLSNGNLSVFMAEYWKHVEFGTDPHIIKPVNKKFLKFKGDGGKEVFAKVVHHPGTRPQPFVRPALFIDLKKIVRRAL